MGDSGFRTRRVGSLGAAALALTLACAGGALAQDAFPSKPFRFIVPFAAGGSGDILSRLVGARLATLYKHQVVIDNRPGAGGHIGADLAAKSPPDGYTIFLGTIGIHSAYAIYSKLTYDPTRDVVPITVIAEFPNVVIVHPSLPVTTFKEFVAYTKANPGVVNFGSAGVGTSTHMIGELYKLAAGANLTHVPYRGSSLALNDLLAGQIQAMFENLPTTPPLIKAGQVRALAVTSARRSPSLPDVPTAIEAGLPNYEATAWFTVAAPTGIPRPILEKLNADIGGILRSPEGEAKLAELGATSVGDTLDRTAAFVAAETVKWTAVIKAADMKVD